MGKKQFEIAELKLLVDAIPSSKFITEKKSNELIRKLTGFSSDYEAAQLKRLDRFGREIQIQKSNKEGWSVTNVDVALSDQFYGWIFSLGTKIRIIEPGKVAAGFADEMRAVGGLYESEPDDIEMCDTVTIVWGIE